MPVVKHLVVVEVMERRLVLAMVVVTVARRKLMVAKILLHLWLLQCEKP